MKKLQKISTSILISMLVMSLFFACGPNGEDNNNDNDNDNTVNVPKELEGIEYRDMVEIEGGQFTQKDAWGNSFSNTVSDFSIGKYEVTYELWFSVHKWAKEHSYYFQNAGMEGSVTGGGEDPNFVNVGKDPTEEAKHEPVTVISWRDAIVWCNAYSELLGYTPVYKSKGEVLKDSRDTNAENCDKATIDPDANGYRLPTEAQWSYAASNKGNTDPTWASGATADYNNADACKEVACYKPNANDKTSKVGTKKVNELRPI